jgi:membrane associated rhomboid family serine protease
MGIYDREYYRREGPSFLSSFTERAHACKWLILINVIVFVIQLLIPTFTEWFWVSRDGVMSGQVWRLVSYAFLHDPDNVFHIIFNMLALWFLGAEIEDLYGSREFVATYLTSAFLGGIAYVVTVVAGIVPNSPCLGASGAVYTVMVLAALHYPNRVIYFFFFPLRLWLIVVIWVGIDAYQFLTLPRLSLDQLDHYPRSAVQVHLAGAAFGFLYYKFQWRMMAIWEEFRSWFGTARRFRPRPRLRVYREEEPATPVAIAPAGPAREVDEHLEAQVDAVLEKVSRHGQASLTDHEREILFRASEVYKKKRT